MDSSEVGSDNNKDKKESNPQYGRWLFIVFLAIAIISLFFRLTGALDTNQYMTLLLTDAFLFVSAMSLNLSNKQLIVSKNQEEVARESIRASRDYVKFAVAPKLIFRIRPANDYWNDPELKQKAGWLPGVGIYIDNFGLGPAFNIRFSVKAFGEKLEQSCVIEFPRMPAGWTYTVPSKQFPNLSVNEEYHDRIIIESLEYEDIRNPPNYYRDKKPEVLELKKDDFNESLRNSEQPTESNRNIRTRARTPPHTFIVKWNLSGDVMSGPYGRIDIPDSDSESKLVVEQHEGEGNIKLICDMRGLRPKARYKLDVCKEYEINSPHFPGRFSDTIKPIPFTTDIEGCEKEEFILRFNDFSNRLGVHTLSVFLNDSVDGRTILISDNFNINVSS